MDKSTGEIDEAFEELGKHIQEAGEEVDDEGCRMLGEVESSVEEAVDDLDKGLHQVAKSADD